MNYIDIKPKQYRIYPYNIVSAILFAASLAASVFYWGGFDLWDNFKLLREQLMQDNLIVFSTVVTVIDVLPYIPVIISLGLMYANKKQRIKSAEIGIAKQKKMSEELNKNIQIIKERNSSYKKERSALENAFSEFQRKEADFTYSIEENTRHYNNVNDAINNIAANTELRRTVKFKEAYHNYLNSMKEINKPRRKTNVF